MAFYLVHAGDGQARQRHYDGTESFMTTCSPEEIGHWAAAARLLVEGVPPVFCFDVLKARRWACVAVEDELENGAAARLAQACAAHGLVAGWSLEIPWEPGPWTPAAHRFTLSATGFTALSKDAYLGSCFVLAEDESRFAVTSDGDLYWMLAGPQTFVEAALGVSVETQLQTFSRVVRAYDGSLAGQRLAAVQMVAVAACAAV